VNTKCPTLGISTNEDLAISLGVMGSNIAVRKLIDLNFRSEIYTALS